MTFPRTKYGFAVNPIGEYARLDYQGRILLGEIISLERDHLTGYTMATVKHFNGESWPIKPAVTSLDWIKQD